MDKKENKLMDMSTNFAVDILQLVTYLQENKVGIIPNQIGRSGTSIGAMCAKHNMLKEKKILFPN